MESVVFEELLLEAFPIWDRTQSPNRGLSRIEMSEDGFLYFLDTSNAQEIIRLLKERLPEDAAICKRFGTRLINDEGDGTGSGIYFIVFASDEWEQRSQGQVLPTISLDSWL